MNPVIPSGPQRTSRRALLKGAGATGAAALLGLAATSPARAAQRSAAGVYDVIVIGAGFAGVTAARELRRSGKKVLILEARDRVGGRTWTDTFLGEKVDLGGAWFDETHPNAWAELQRYAVPTTTDSAPDATVFPTDTGFRTYTPAEGFAHTEQLVTPLFDGSRDYFPNPLDPWAREDLLRPVDNVSMRAKLSQYSLSPADTKWLSGAMGGLAGGAARGALTQMAQWWALSNWDYKKFSNAYSVRPVQGTVALIQAMLTEASADLVLNSPVASVTHSGDRVQVVTRGGVTHQAAKAVVAVPVNVWKDITFNPGLPTVYREASTATIGVPTAKKLWLHIRSDKGMLFTRGEETAPIGTIIPSYRLGDGYLAYAFSIDPALDVANTQQIEAAVQRFDPGATLLAARGHDWGNDPYARGGWTFKQPGQLTRTLRSIQQPVGRVAFANSDIATGWSGWIDGAIESGRRAAAHVAGA
ncbi:flavin monoamine oxidase family protein [Streptomyces sp. NPDC102283]|uniref:flavin monoamine oxidase family protein n=1 Tax=Streptomyces sp. NPDC102283 TaxID=3366155 RepID=UPI00382C219A